MLAAKQTGGIMLAAKQIGGVMLAAKQTGGVISSHHVDLIEIGVALLDKLVTRIQAHAKRRICDTGWTMFHSSCYKLFRQRVSWDEAKTRCELANAVLASITSQEETDFIYAKLLLETGKVNVWIGASDIENEGTWKWISGEDWAYERFVTGEARGSDTENCLCVGDDNWWYALPCNDNKNDYLCEKQI
ncbi:snaclec subunit B-like [Mya arenaria]|uniref:snaclec subunit B-like n=1 Tax=Mya arenaria TaxID=6604 RepID=UPI0022E8E4AC|nr:snaclec subunit B-like [Mya arenaria]